MYRTSCCILVKYNFGTVYHINIINNLINIKYKLSQVSTNLINISNSHKISKNYVWLILNCPIKENKQPSQL